LLRNRVAVVVGGGDSAMQEALTLAQFTSRVVIINRAADLTGQASFRDRVAGNGKIEVHNNAVVEEILGDNIVSGIRMRAMTDGAASDLEASGVFVYIGLQAKIAADRYLADGTWRD
jgi:thioredoxin reductase (NADPH)